MTLASPAALAKQPFPRTFYFANAIELLERLAFYGTYVGLSLYLTNVVGLSDRASGTLLGNYRFVGQFAPVVCGVIADRITFKRSLIVAFVLYTFGYIALFTFPTPGLTVAALMCMAVAGGFMKPVIAGTVIRTAPEGRQVEGFAIFYRMINAGSVVGKTLAYGVRVILSLRYVMITSVVASLGALGIAIFAYEEPARGRIEERGAPGPSLASTLKGYATALSNVRFALFLLVASGFYFMSEQFYMTFPKYVTRHIDGKAPLEIITLVNPAFIALFQGMVVKVFRNLRPLTALCIGMVIGTVSMLAMGAWPTLGGACLSLALFALAEMCFSPRFYDHIASFAPEGKAGLYMGLALVPFAVGALVGGQISGSMIAQYMPATGERSPFVLWSSYAGLGLLCAGAMLAYRAMFNEKVRTAQG